VQDNADRWRTQQRWCGNYMACGDLLCMAVGCFVWDIVFMVVQAVTTVHRLGSLLVVCGAGLFVE